MERELKGLIRPSGLYKAPKGSIRALKGLIKPLRALLDPLAAGFIRTLRAS